MSPSSCPPYDQFVISHDPTYHPNARVEEKIDTTDPIINATGDLMTHLFISFKKEKCGSVDGR